MVGTLFSAGILAAWILVPGMAWSRWLRAPVVARFAAAVFAGIGLVLPSAVMLAEAGILSAGSVTAVVAVLAWAGWRVNRPPAGEWMSPRGVLRDGLPMYLTLAAGGAALLLLPPPGEWIAGGWDPGVLLNEAAWIGRTGSLQPADPAFAELARDPRLSLFLSNHLGLREAYPGLPFDSSAGRWTFYFYPGTPVLGALLGQAAGLDAVVRLPLFTAALALLAVAGAAAALAGSSLAGAACALALAAQPIWLYHARTPNSEMLELALLAALFLWLRIDAPGRTRGPVWFALMLSLTLNRISAILFGALLIVVTASDVRQRPRGFWPWMAAGLLAGWMYYLFSSPDSMVKLGHVMPRILEFAAAAVVGGGILVVADRLPERLQRILPWLVFAGGIAGWLALESAGPDPWREWAGNLNALGAYLQPAVALAAAGGCLALAILHAPARIPVFTLALSLLVVLHEKHAAELYPWALKRYLPFAAPLVAALFPAMVRIGRAVRLPVFAGTGLAALALAATILAQRPLIREAVQEREFVGLSRHLALLSHPIPPRAIVIADHFRWATPLAAFHGHTVLNGEALWKRTDPALTERVLDALREYHRPVVWMTGTRDGLAVFPRTEPWTAVELARPEPLTFRETIHHPRNRGFSTRAVTLYGALYIEP